MALSLQHFNIHGVAYIFGDHTWKLFFFLFQNIITEGEGVIIIIIIFFNKYYICEIILHVIYYYDVWRVNIFIDFSRKKKITNSNILF